MKDRLVLGTVLVWALVVVVGVGFGFVPVAGAPPAKFEVGSDHFVNLDLHYGYSEVSYLATGSELWQFSEGGSADSILVTGHLRRLSADKAVFVVGGVSHSLVRVAQHGDSICI